MNKGYSAELNSEIYEFDIISKLNFTPIKGQKTKSIYYKIIATMDENGCVFYVAKFADGVKNTAIKSSFIATANYSGKIYLLNKDEEIISAKKYFNGTFVGNIMVSDYKVNSYMWLDCTTIAITHYSTSYVEVGGQYFYTTRVTGTTYETICTGGGGGSGGGGYGDSGGGGSSDQYEDAVEDQIIDELTEKAKCLNALLDKNGNSFVKNLLANFEGESEFDIKIVSKDKVTTLDKNGVTKEVNGKTVYLPGSTLITIEISTSRTNQNAAIEGARTILHEYIHADIYRKLYTKYDASGVLDFKTTYDEYTNQHETMAVLYLNSMKEALKAFHKNVLTDDYNMYINYYGEAPTDAFYEALAWGGPRDNDVKAWTDLPAEKKVEIEALANRVPLLSKTVPCPN